MFEWTIRVGDILTLIGGISVAATIIVKRVTSDASNKIILGQLAKEFSEMKDEFKAFSHTLAKVAVQESKIDLLMKWYDELRRGVGKIE